MNKPEGKAVRNSSLELLRILGMLSIVAYHFSFCGGFDFPTDSITVNRLWQQFILTGSGLGTCIFVMMSGYFLINSKGINFRKIFDLWARIFFYSVVIYCLLVLTGQETFNPKSALNALMPVTHQQWWFASAYFLMYLIHPYVNRLLHTFTRDEYRKFLLSVLIFWYVLKITLGEFGASPIVRFVFLYALAAYPRLYPDDFPKRKYILWGLALIMVNLLLTVILDVIGLKFAVAGRAAGGHLISMMIPTTFIAVLCLILGFKDNINIPNNKVINTIASATLGVYLIHENDLVRPFLWVDVFRNASFQDSPYFVPYSIGVVITVYLLCTVIELLRQKMFRVLSGNRLS